MSQEPPKPEQDWKPKIILGRSWIEALIAAGVIPKMTTSCTIRATVDEPVMIDYTVLGDDRLLTIDPLAYGIPMRHLRP